MRLIDADALKANVPDTSADIFENCRNCKTLMDWEVKELIDQQPAAVVRCGECKYHMAETERTNPYCNKYHCMRTDDWFCADGEREVQE